ncbi:MAG TPA: SH3 domain-containing protein [Cerasibacillus sp.]|uniref:SH3 domain-containing protein n=1 Tax=Cerasibacillus sp. TaxID=2498711 RepID=UPI002F403281
MKKKVNLMFMAIALIFSVFLISGQDVASAKTAVKKASGTYQVTAKNLSIRTNAGTKYKKVGSLVRGTEININGKKGNWYRFKYKGKNRYVSSKLLKKSKVYKASGTYQVTAKSLSVRTNAGSKYKKIGSLARGTEIKVNGKKGNWYRFRHPDGFNRYVSSKHLNKSKVYKASGRYEVVPKSLNVRTNAGTKYKKVGTLKRGKQIIVNGKKGSWYRFKYNGYNRYISSKSLIRANKSSKKSNFKNCTELRKVYPDGVPKGHPAYEPRLDRDKDNWACER